MQTIYWAGVVISALTIILWGLLARKGSKEDGQSNLLIISLVILCGQAITTIGCIRYLLGT